MCNDYILVHAQVTNIDGYDDLKSLASMWTQTDDIYKTMKPEITGNESVILICFSQGFILTVLFYPFIIIILYSYGIIVFLRWTTLPLYS